MSKVEVGILAIQGDFTLHQAKFESLGATVQLIRRPGELDAVKRLVIPGGESTTMQLLIDRYGIRTELEDFCRSHPVWGTCAGMILLASSVDDARIRPLKIMDISVERNAYGRQINSFIGHGMASLNSTGKEIDMVFIRAPRIVEMSSKVEPIARCGKDVTMARQGRILVTSFHPELSEGSLVHRYFLDM